MNKLFSCISIIITNTFPFQKRWFLEQFLLLSQIQYMELLKKLIAFLELEMVVYDFGEPFLTYLLNNTLYFMSDILSTISRFYL